jgi:hypothetical protein
LDYTDETFVNFETLGKIGKFDVLYTIDNGVYIFSVFDGNNPMNLATFKLYDILLNEKLTLECLFICTLPKYKGNKLTFKLYSFLLNKFNLISGDVHMNQHIVDVWSELKLHHQFSHIDYNNKTEITGDIYGKYAIHMDRRIILY